MSLTAAILASYRSPRRVVAGLIAQDRREGRLLFYLMLACGLLFVAQWPRLMRQAGPDLPLEGLLAGTLFALVFVAPLLIYGIAALLALGLRLARRGATDAFAVRLALFWALLATSPLVLAQAALTTLAPGAGQVGGLVVAAAFLALLIGGLRAALADPAAPA